MNHVVPTLLPLLGTSIKGAARKTLCAYTEFRTRRVRILDRDGTRIPPI